MWFLYLVSGILVLLVLFMFVVRFIYKMEEREKIDPEYKERNDKRKDKIAPYLNFFENLFWWVIVFAVIIFVYM